MPRSVDEHIFKRWLADRNRLNFAGKGLHHVGNKAMAFLPFIAIAVIFYVLLIRPQRREQSTREAMLAALKKNDKVVTIGVARLRNGSKVNQEPPKEKSKKKSA